MLAHALFPDHTHHLLAWLAVPVAVADALGVLADAVPSSTQQAVRSKAQALKAQLQKQQQADSLQGAAASRGIGWVDGVQGVVAGSLHTFRSLSGVCLCVLQYMGRSKLMGDEILLDKQRRIELMGCAPAGSRLAQYCSALSLGGGELP